MCPKDPLRRHLGREILQHIQKFGWRYQTLRLDYEGLMQLRDIPEQFIRTVEGEQIMIRGYLFDVERRLHHYLAGVYTLTQVAETLEDELPAELSTTISDNLDPYDDEDSTKVIKGMRHFVQHSNKLPVTIRSSNLDDHDREVVIDLQDLDWQGGRGEYNRGFEHHYGSIDGPYLYPFEQIEENWNVTEVLFENVLKDIHDEVDDEITDFVEEIQRYSEIMNSIIEEELPGLKRYLDG